MDQHVPRAITLGLRMRDVDVLTAHEDGASRLSDAELLDRANELKRVLVTRDEDLLIETAYRQRMGIEFSGVIYAHQLRVPIGQWVDQLEVISKAGEAADFASQALFLPL